MSSLNKDVEESMHTDYLTLYIHILFNVGISHQESCKSGSPSKLS